MKKILIVTNIPNPYRIPLFNEINKQLEKEDRLLKVVFGAESYARRKWRINLDEIKFDFEILNSRMFKIGSVEKTLFSYSGLYSLFKREKPDIIISLGFSLATFKTLFYSKINRKPFFIWTGSVLQKKRNNSTLRIFLRKIMVKYASGFITYGKKAGEYLELLGANSSDIFIAINTVDTDFFLSIKKNNEKTDINYITYIGELTPRKNVSKLLTVVECLINIRNDFKLEIIGDGSEKALLKNIVNKKGLQDYVVFHGYKQKIELPEYLSRSSCFLFQTDFDIWGLVLVEAMAAGIPCISSVYAGATYDLIKDNENGFALDFTDYDKVAEKINWILDNPDEAAEMGRNAQNYIKENVTIPKSAEGFLRAVEKV